MLRAEPPRCQDAWKGTGPDTAQTYPTWMLVYKDANESQVINLWEKNVPHQNARNSFSNIQWISMDTSNTMVYTLYTFLLPNSTFASPL